MKDFDQKKLEALLSENKLDEAKEYIHQALTAPDPDANANAAIEYALAYLKAVNSINADYLKSLKETSALLRETKLAEGKASDSLKLAKLKKELDIGN